jgi:glycosyltransferase involved in cell wall biosynthesis
MIIQSSTDAQPRLRILTLSNCDLVETQGSGYVIVNFARGLESRGHSVRLIGPTDCILWPQQRKARSLRLAWGMWRHAPRLVRETRPDVVEFWGAESCLAVRRLARISNRHFKIVARSNGIEPLVEETLARHRIHNNPTGLPLKWYQGRIRLPLEQAFSCADAIVTVSKPESEYALHRGFQTSDRVLPIDNALPEEFLGQRFMAERPKMIGYCGSWLPIKGVKLMAEAMTEVLRDARDWKLHLVGVGHSFRVADHFPADVQSQIESTAFIANKDQLRAIYQTWRIALLTSFYESFGLVAAEAMACGCALVATRTGFATSLKHGEEAMLISPDAAQLHAAVMAVIADESLRLRIAQAGWRSVQGLTWAQSIGQLESFYRDLTLSAGTVLNACRK